MQRDAVALHTSHFFWKHGSYEYAWQACDGPQVPGPQSMMVKHPGAQIGFSPQPGVSQRQPGSIAQASGVVLLLQKSGGGRGGQSLTTTCHIAFMPPHVAVVAPPHALS